MVLTIDIGNSNIILGVYQDERLLFVSRVRTSLRKTESEYAVLLKDILLLHGVQCQALRGGIISSVVPPLTPVLRAAVTIVHEIPVMVVGPGLRTGLNIRIDNPGQLGADLVATAVGAVEKYPAPILILDLRTATKITVVDRNRSFRGGSIMPGVMIALDALTRNAAQLPDISLEGDVKLVGTNTVDCMRSGVVLGAASMLDGMIDRYQQELGEFSTIVACGGMMKLILPYCRHAIQMDDSLLLDGLYAISRRNAPEAT